MMLIIQMMEKRSLVVGLNKSIKAIDNLKTSMSLAMNNNNKVFFMSALNKDDVNNFKSNFLVDLDFYFCDETALKTIIRSNPSLIELQKGTIVQKLHWNDASKLKLSNNK